MKTQFDYNSHTYSVDLTPIDKAYSATLNGETYSVEVIRAVDGQLDLLIYGKPVHAMVSSDGAKRWVTVDGQTFVLTKTAEGTRPGVHGGHTSDELVAPMPGLVRAVHVIEGASVTKGQTLMIVEAMKMEIKVVAPRAGLVKALKVRQGQTVEREQILIELES